MVRTSNEDLDSIDIHSECFDKDFDDIQFELEVIPADNDEEMSQMFGY